MERRGVVFRCFLWTRRMGMWLILILLAASKGSTALRANDGRITCVDAYLQALHPPQAPLVPCLQTSISLPPTPIYTTVHSCIFRKHPPASADIHCQHPDCMYSMNVLLRLRYNNTSWPLPIDLGNSACILYSHTPATKPSSILGS